MDSVELLTQFANPETIKALTVSQRLTAGLITTVLGMGITFTALIILQFVIGLMAKLGATKQPVETTAAPSRREPDISPLPDPGQTDDEQLIAAITTALAVTLKTSTSNIIVRNIRKIEDHSPAWNRAGIAEQMNNNS